MSDILFNEVKLLYYSVWAPLCRRWDPLPSCSAWGQPPLTCPATPRYRGCRRPNSHPAVSPSPTGRFNFSLTSWFNKGSLIGAHYVRVLLLPKHKGILYIFLWSKRLRININDSTITSPGAEISGFEKHILACSVLHSILPSCINHVRLQYWCLGSFTSYFCLSLL